MYAIVRLGSAAAGGVRHSNANRDLAAGGHELVRDVGVTTLMSIHDVNLAPE